MSPICRMDSACGYVNLQASSYGDIVVSESKGEIAKTLLTTRRLSSILPIALWK